jgi:uncharacterized protein (TIGR03067 family)
MLFRWWWATCLLLLVVAVGRAGEAEKELEKLQGDWVAVSGETGGRPLLPKEVEQIKMTIKEDKWISAGIVKGTYALTLDPTADPKHLEMKGTEGPLKGTVSLCIYKLDGDTLTVCTGTSKTRPKDFVSKGNQQLESFHLFVFKRVKP